MIEAGAFKAWANSRGCAWTTSAEGDQAGVRGLVNLPSLSLRGNALEVIEAGAFEGLDNLERCWRQRWR